MKENNRVIAEFMGIPKCDRCNECGMFKYGTGIYYKPEAMGYHTSWDWLMPVVEKIETVKMSAKKLNVETFDNKQVFFKTIIFARCCDIQMENVVFGNVQVEVTAAPSKIEAVYNAVIQFIQWYNSNKQP